MATTEAARLTKQQRRALLLWRGWPYDFVTDGQVWDEARHRPWPTMDNLIAKGLIQRHGWIDEDAGWEYDLTDDGRALLKVLTDETERTPE